MRVRNLASFVTGLSPAALPCPPRWVPLQHVPHLEKGSEGKIGVSNSAAQFAHPPDSR
jgi:hypothetical protein